MGFRSLISNDDTVEHKLQSERDLRSRDTAGIMDQTAPVVIQGMHGQRILAYEIAARTDPVDDIPKVYPHSRAPLQRSSAADSYQTDQMLMTDVGVHLFQRLDGQMFRIRGQLLPPDPAPFNVSYLGGIKWFVKGGMWRIRQELLAPGPSGETIITREFEVKDTKLIGDQGWIVLYIQGNYISTSGDGIFEISETPVIRFERVLSHDLELTLSGDFGLTITRTGSFGMLPIAWVSVNQDGKIIILDRAELFYFPPLGNLVTLVPEQHFSTFTETANVP